MREASVLGPSFLLSPWSAAGGAARGAASVSATSCSCCAPLWTAMSLLLHLGRVHGAMRVACLADGRTNLIITPEHGRLALAARGQIAGPWEVSFDPQWGGPEKVTFASLTDWSQNPEPGIKYYSGKAVYRTTFNLPGGSLLAGKKYFLDLGLVKNLARIRLNGRDLGVVWCYPWRVNVSAALQARANHLEIEVANLWPNRLIGDQSLPPEKRLAWTTLNPCDQNSPLFPSGLLGPVNIFVANDPGSQ